jgi:hypothetical protein
MQALELRIQMLSNLKKEDTNILLAALLTTTEPVNKGKC